MELNEFKKKISNVAIKDSSESLLYLTSTYEDILNILEISKETNKISNKITLHKSLYEFATIFLTKLLREKWSYFKSITSFVKDDDCPLDRDKDFVLKAYCLVAYRHKIIAHHDYVKTEYEDVDKSFRILASPNHSNNSWGEKLNTIKLKYKYLISDSLNNSSDLDIVNFLFYKTPLKDENGKWNLDREAIDFLVQEVGCKSYTQEEILKIVDDFFLALV